MPNKNTLRRITRELQALQQSKYTSLQIDFREDDLYHVNVLVTGPHGTPYEFGFFEFAVTFPKIYPEAPPGVKCLTTNQGRTRFNPNIYSSGKVCLSTLGTWSGLNGETWTSALGLESVMVSIQSITNSNPCRNHPGYDKMDQFDMAFDLHELWYMAKVHHEKLRIAVIQRMEAYLGIYLEFDMSAWRQQGSMEEASKSTTPQPFEDYCKQHFLWHFDVYMSTIDHYQEQFEERGYDPEHELFRKCPWESQSNGMHGSFNWPELRTRLLVVRQALDLESLVWATEGRLLNGHRHASAKEMAHIYQDLADRYRKSNTLTADIDLVHGNPFEWRVSYYGQPNTLLDGAVIPIRMTVSPSFPLLSPRVRLEKPLYHHRVGKDGVLCYHPRKPSELGSHLEAMLDTLVDKNPHFDPNLAMIKEVYSLFWHANDNRKLYTSKLRESIKQSGKIQQGKVTRRILNAAESIEGERQDEDEAVESSKNKERSRSKGECKSKKRCTHSRA